MYIAPLGCAIYVSFGVCYGGVFSIPNNILLSTMLVVFRPVIVFCKRYLYKNYYPMLYVLFGI